MTEMNEAEVLEHAFYAGRAEALRGPPNTSERDVMRSGLLAVAAKARELDAARGGTLTVEQLNGWRARIRQYIGTAAVEEFDTHLFAQGRTIAEKDARIAELKAKLAEWGAKDGNSPGYNREKAATYGRKAQEFRERAEAAESALATLRQELERELVGWSADRSWCRRCRTEQAQALDAQGRRIPNPHRHAAGCVLSATPAEHPDTATREDYPPAERAKRVVLKLNTLLLPYASGEEGNRDVVGRVRRLLQDVETLRGIRERASDKAALGRISLSSQYNLRGEAIIAAVRWVVLGDSGPSGGGEKVPTTPPDVAASEHPVAGVVFSAHASEHPIAIAARDAIQRGGEKWLAGGMDGTPTPTHEEDWRTVEKGLQHSKTCVQSLANAPSNRPCTCGVSAAREALTRLKDAPRRAAERMRGKADVAVLMLQPPASLLKQCETSAEANAVRGAWCAAINAAVDAIRALEVTP